MHGACADCQYSQRIPVKAGVDGSHIGSIAGDIHAATLVGSVERHADSVQEQIPNGEHIICNIQGYSVLNADTGLDGVNGAAKLASTVGLQRQKMMSCHVPWQHFLELLHVRCDAEAEDELSCAVAAFSMSFITFLSTC